MKPCVVEDSNFIISVIDPDESFHFQAILLLNELITRKNNIKIIIPSIVFFESVIKLLQRGVSPKKVENSLWDFLYRSEILNVTFPETAAFRIGKYLQGVNLEIKTSDLLVGHCGIEYEAQILTSDKTLWRALKKNNYQKAYYWHDRQQRNDFLKELDELIRRSI